MAVMMRWWRWLRGGVWHYTRGRFEGSTIYMWVREPIRIPATVQVLATEDYMRDDEYPRLNSISINGEYLIEFKNGRHCVSADELDRLRDALIARRGLPKVSDHTNEFGDVLVTEFVRAIRRAADEIESGPQYAGTVLHALVEDLFELGYEPETEPPVWTEKPPARDCWWKPKWSGRTRPIALHYQDGEYQASPYSTKRSHAALVIDGQLGGRFLAIPGGIPSPE